MVLARYYLTNRRKVITVQIMITVHPDIYHTKETARSGYNQMIWIVDIEAVHCT